MSEEAIPVPDLGTPEPSEQLPPVVEPDAILTGHDIPRRRRRKSTPPPPPEPASHVASVEEKTAIAAALGMGWRVLFQIVASKRGEHWTLSEGDEKLLGETWATALEPYLATSAKYMPIAIATLATAGVVVPRVQRDAELAGTPMPEHLSGIRPTMEVVP